MQSHFFSDAFFDSLRFVRFTDRSTINMLRFFLTYISVQYKILKGASECDYGSNYSCCI
ncbi:MAG: hypothetical protein LBR79_06065 [Oscillospiraceae bacterium]|nr:hypothetical protein [Oscillospiraceae bacterium]